MAGWGAALNQSDRRPISSFSRGGFVTGADGHLGSRHPGRADDHAGVAGVGFSFTAVVAGDAAHQPPGR